MIEMIKNWIECIPLFKTLQISKEVSEILENISNYKLNMKETCAETVNSFATCVQFKNFDEPTLVMLLSRIHELENIINFSLFMLSILFILSIGVTLYLKKNTYIKLKYLYIISGIIFIVLLADSISFINNFKNKNIVSKTLSESRKIFEIKPSLYTNEVEKELGILNAREYYEKVYYPRAKVTLKYKVNFFINDWDIKNDSLYPEIQVP